MVVYQKRLTHCLIQKVIFLKISSNSVVTVLAAVHLKTKLVRLVGAAQICIRLVFRLHFQMSKVVFLILQ